MSKFKRSVSGKELIIHGEKIAEYLWSAGDLAQELREFHHTGGQGCIFESVAVLEHWIREEKAALYDAQTDSIPASFWWRHGLAFIGGALGAILFFLPEILGHQPHY